MTKRETVIFNGTCYSFALGLIQERLLKQGQWTPEKAIKFSDKLSQEVKKTVQNFLEHRLVFPT